MVTAKPFNERLFSFNVVFCVWKEKVVGGKGTLKDIYEKRTEKRGSKDKNVSFSPSYRANFMNSK